MAWNGMNVQLSNSIFSTAKPAIRRTSGRIAVHALMWTCGMTVCGDMVDHMFSFRLASNMVSSTASPPFVGSSE